MAAVAASVGLLAWWGPVTEAGVGWPAWLKVVLTVLMIAPPAFFMGVPLPTGLALLQLRHKPSVKWAGRSTPPRACSARSGAMFLAIYAGLQRTLLVGGGLYVLALPCWSCCRRTAAEAAAAPSVLAQR